jgi:DNA-binding MarR family transcriptional regulator
VPKSFERHAQELVVSSDAPADQIDVSNGYDFIAEISRLLSNTYDSIDRLETLTQRSHGIDLTVSELNLIEVVGRKTLHKDATIGMSELARTLDIRVPSATAAVNRLVKRGYVQKKRDPEDARRVNVVLTRKGEKVFRLHAVFNQRMAQEVSDGLSVSERRVLLDGIRRLEHFYAKAQQSQREYLKKMSVSKGGRG